MKAPSLVSVSICLKTHLGNQILLPDAPKETLDIKDLWACIFEKKTEIKHLQIKTNVSFSTPIVPVQQRNIFYAMLHCILLQILSNICRTPARKSKFRAK